MAEKLNTLYDEFSMQGEWFLPSNPTEKISGVLKFSSSGIKLELNGSLMAIPELLKNGQPSKVDVILGYTKSKYVTLINGFLNGFSLGGVHSTTLFFSKMIIGAHFNKLEDIVLDSLDINYSYLEEWLGVAPFSRNIIEDSTQFLQQATAIYTPPNEEQYYIDEINTTLKTGYTMNFSGSFSKKINMTHLSYLTVIPNESMNINNFIDITRKLQELLTLFMNRTITPKILKGKYTYVEDDENKSQSIYIYMIPENALIEDEIHFTDRYIDYISIKDNLEKILNNWFGNSELRSALKNYLRNINNIDLDLESKFLNYAKALETLHRNTNSDAGQFMSDEDYGKVRSAMIATLPESVDGDLTNKLSSTLKYAHHYGFERRVRELLKNLPDSIKDKIFDCQTDTMTKKLRKFASDITTSRDYYTHYGDTPEYYFLEWDLYLANRRLHTVLFYHLNKILEVNEALLAQKILRNMYLINDLERAKEILPN